MPAFLFLSLYLLLVPLRVDAYLDPGSGSLIFQVVIAFFVGIAFAVKQNWLRFTSIFRRGKGPDGRRETDDGARDGERDSSASSE